MPGHRPLKTDERCAKCVSIGVNSGAERPKFHTDSHTVVVEAAAHPMQGLHYGLAAPGPARLLPPLTAARRRDRPTEAAGANRHFCAGWVGIRPILHKSRQTPTHASYEFSTTLASFST